MSRKVVCGIDFGTSNSACTVVDGAAVQMIPLEKNKQTMPSALFFNENQTVSYGREAIAHYINGEEGRLMRGLKSILGTSLMDEKTRVGRRSVSFTDILSTYLKRIKSIAEEQKNTEINSVVLGRPVHFHDDREDLDIKAQQVLSDVARDVGFEQVYFQYEPIAAAFSHEQKLNKEKLSLVVDLGGGTSDFTVIRLSGDNKKKSDRKEDILSTKGIKVGGTDFDYILSMKFFMPELGLNSYYRSGFEKDKHLQMPSSTYADLSTWSKVNWAQTRQASERTKYLLRYALEPKKVERLLTLQQDNLGHAFLQGIERVKILMKGQDRVCAGRKELALDCEVSVDRHAFEENISAHIIRIFNCIDECLEDAGILQDDIELVILTGGSSELEVVNSLIKNKFPRAEISKENKLSSVGTGLGYYAKNLFL